MRGLVCAATWVALDLGRTATWVTRRLGSGATCVGELASPFLLLPLLLLSFFLFFFLSAFLLFMHFGSLIIIIFGLEIES